MHKQIFWSGGIGDILCLEATFTDAQRKSITRMYWATRTKPHLAPLFTKFPSFPYLKDHVSLWDTYNLDKISFPSFAHAFAETLYPHLVEGTIDDWSIVKRFNKPQPFTYGSFVKYNLTNIDSFNLPSKYVAICPYSDTSEVGVQQWRRFSDRDWKWLFRHLRKSNMYGVILNSGVDVAPQNKWLIDLSNKTNLPEAIEIVKHASAYIGIDSGLSVVAAQVLPVDRIIISTKNAVLWIYKHVYYAPQTEFNFIIPYLGATKKDCKEWRAGSDIMNPLFSDPD
jgi:hypothetical protein